MASWISPLLPLFEAERAAGRPLALAAVLHTAGSTYRKAGALMLITGDGRFAGLLSGGCLESDLAEHARKVIETGAARIVSYDLRNPDDVLWGLGVGCEGAMDILLARTGPANGWEPLAGFAAALEAQRPIATALVVESRLASGPPAGAVAMLRDAPDAAPVFVAPDGARGAAGRRSLTFSTGRCAPVLPSGWKGRICGSLPRRLHCRRGCCCSAPAPIRCRCSISARAWGGNSPSWIIGLHTHSPGASRAPRKCCACARRKSRRRCRWMILPPPWS